MKKLKFILSALFGVMLLTMVQSCTDHFDELNTSPTLVGADVVDPAMLFANAVRDGVYQIPNYSGNVKEYAGYDVSQSSGNIFLEAARAGSFDMYTNQIVSISEMIRLTEDDPWYANYNAKGRIWRVWLFQHITDHYGDIPYFEAALAQEETVSHPAYDPQEAIYTDMMEQLAQAAADLQDSPDRGSLGSSDLLYGGDVEKWRRFANSLRLRYALRVRFANESLAQQHISNVIDEPLIEDNSQNAYIMTLPDGTTHNSNRHPMFNSNISPLNPFACTHTMVYNMREATSPDLDMDDPRLPIWCLPAQTDGEYRGNVINRRDGCRGFHTNDNISHLNDRLLRADQPINVMTHSEVEFNKAESYLAGLVSGDAQEAYEAGLRSALEFYEVDEADISAFLASSAGTLSGDDEDQLRQISTQRWLSLYGQTAEGYSEWRRTGYPIIYTYPSDDGHTNRQVPRRNSYPTSEYDRNNANLQEAIDRLGEDSITNRIWWDARPGLPLQHPDWGLFPPPPDQDVTVEGCNP